MYAPLRWSIVGLLLAVAALGWENHAAAQQRGPTAEQLQQFLKRFPKADANGDGKLTVEEARQYKQQNAEGGRNAQRGQRVEPTMADVSYGPHERNVLDFYKAKSDQPTPLIIYIHGGGFVGGNKESFNPTMLQGALDSGISCAALHYRFVDGEEIIFPTPQRDCARALQFIRSKAKEWNINPTKVACFGGSAGAGISMWLGFHDDLADPKSDDPIARQSTRIQAIGTLGGQTTYDPIKIKELVGGRAWEHPSMFKVYGNQTPEEALNPSTEMQALYDEASAITHLSADDPPIYMVYSEAKELPENPRPGQGIHSYKFGLLLQKEMDAIGIENVYVYAPEAPDRNPNQEMLEFFQRHLGMTQ